METESPEEQWGCTVYVESRPAKFLVSHANKITILVALAAVIVGVLTVFVIPALWPIRLVLSFITLLFAYISTGRVNQLSVNINDADSVETTVVHDEKPESGKSTSSDRDSK
jgi:hypothetical protein